MTQCADPPAFFPLFLLPEEISKSRIYFQSDAENPPLNTVVSNLQLLPVVDAVVLFILFGDGVFFLLQGIASQSIDISSFTCSPGSSLECTVGNQLKQMKRTLKKITL